MSCYIRKAHIGNTSSSSSEEVILSDFQVLRVAREVEESFFEIEEANDTFRDLISEIEVNSGGYIKIKDVWGETHAKKVKPSVYKSEIGIFVLSVIKTLYATNRERNRDTPAIT